MTNLEFTDFIMYTLDQVRKDSFISRKAVLDYGYGVVAKILAQYKEDITNEELELYKETVLIPLCYSTTVVVNGSTVPRLYPVMVSKDAIPTPLKTNKFNGVLGVYTVDNAVQFTYASQGWYNSYLKSPYSEGAGCVHYYLLNGRDLILPNSQIEAVNLRLLTLDLSTQDDSGQFNCPERFISTVIRETAEYFMTTMLSIPADELPNINTNEV